MISGSCERIMLVEKLSHISGLSCSILVGIALKLLLNEDDQNKVEELYHRTKHISPDENCNRNT